MHKQLTTPVRQFRICGKDPVKVSEFVSGLTGKAVYEALDQTNFDNTIDLSVIGSVVAWRSVTDSGFAAYSLAKENDRIELHFVEEGHYRSITSEQDISASQGQAYFLRHTHEHRIFSQAGTRQISLAIPFRRYAKLIAPEIDDPYEELTRFLPLVAYDIAPVKTLSQITSILIAAEEEKHPLIGAPLGVALLKESLLGIFAEAWPRTSTQGSVRRANTRHVRRAVEWIHAHIGERIYLEEIAQAAGVSVRSLQTGFRHQYGMSPMAFILKARLQEVHHEILTSDTERSITEIAHRWGFSNRGEFASRYRQLYGESPSETKLRTLKGR